MERADIVLQAHAVGCGLTDLERIALGATLIQTVLMSDRHPAVLIAARHIREHGEALQDAAFFGVESFDTLPPDFDTSHTANGPDTGKATTHEQPGPLADPGPDGHGATTPRVATSSRWRAAWQRIRHAERRFADSLWGDVVAGICAIAAFGGASLLLAVVFH